MSTSGLGRSSSLPFATKRPVLNSIGNRVPHSKGQTKPTVNLGARCLRSKTILAQAQKVASAKVSKPTKLDDVHPAVPVPAQVSAGPVALLDSVMEVDELEEVAEPMQTHTLSDRVKDVDQDDHIFMCSKYTVDIHRYLKELETKNTVNAAFMEKQKETTCRMRSILVDWLVQVHFRFHLMNETLYLTMAILDRYIQAQEVSKDELQLLGVTAMLIAAKFEETYVPAVKDFVYITDETYTKQQIIKMEMNVLRALDFELSIPLGIHFLRRVSKVAGCDAVEHTTSKYLLELCMTEDYFSSLPPSLLAAAVGYLSLRLHRKDSFTWDDTLAYYTQYDSDDLVPFVRKVSVLLISDASSKLDAVRNKYARSRFFKVSMLPQLTSNIILKWAK